MRAKEYTIYPGIQLRNDTFIIPQNTGIFAALQQSENGLSKIMLPKQVLLCDAHSPFD
jgi:hypothetical protein